MAELAIRKTNGNGHHQQQRQASQPAPMMPPAMMHPLRWMRELMNLSELGQLRQGVMAAFDVKETPEALVFKADLPGFTEKDLEITAAGQRLTISGTRQDEREDKGDTFYVMERRHGRFSRSFTLPQGVDLDKVAAELKQGVLTITVPRASAGQAKKIAVKASTPKS